MLVGAMNHPGSDIAAEIEWMAEMGLDFVDLTIEPPQAASWQVDPAKIAEILRSRSLQVVGHTAYYLPFASPFEEIQQAAIRECLRCMEVFRAVGARWMNIHPDTDRPLHTKSFCTGRNLEVLGALVEHGRKVGVGVMVENIPGNDFNSVEDLGLFLDALPQLGLHLDLGHANLSTVPQNAGKILAKYGDRLRHVHLHDNKGGTEDLHLPLGAGTLDVRRAVRALKSCGYDGTITLEVFSADRHYLEHSVELLRNTWASGD